jgi:hypothetical protein
MKGLGVFMKRAFETSRSTFLQRYRSLLCIAAAAAFAVCLSPSASAQTQYEPSTYACLSGGNYQAPEDITNTTGDLDAETVNSTVYTVHCTWSGFPHFYTTSPLTIHVGVNYGSNIGSGPNGSHCGGGSASVTGAYVQPFHASCNTGDLMETGEVPAGIWLDTLALTGTVSTRSGNPVGVDDNAVLTISSISIY